MRFPRQINVAIGIIGMKKTAAKREEAASETHSANSGCIGSYNWLAVAWVNL